MYTIFFKKSAEKELAAINTKDQRRLASAIDALAANPRPHGCEKLSGSDPFWRIRVGDYRVVYQIEDKVITITIVRIGHRRDVYRRR